VIYNKQKGVHPSTITHVRVLHNKPMKYWNVCLFVCIALVLISCSNGQTEEVHAVTPAKSSPTMPTLHPTPMPTTLKVSLTPLSMQQAWGQIRIHQLSLDLGDRYFAPDAQHSGMTADDQICGSTYTMRPQAGNWSQDSESIGLINVHTGHITLLATMPAGYSLIACTVTGPWVIWSQTYGNTFESDAALWILKALNRQTGEVRLLDQGHGSDGQHPSASIRPEPYASNGRVVWTTYSQNTPGSTQSEMYTFATGTKTVLAPQTSGPQISWPWVSWGDGVGRAMVFENLETAQQVRLPMQYPPTTAAFAGTSFVYTNSDYSQVIWIPSIQAQPMGSYVIEDKQRDGSDFDEFPTLNSRLISWVGPNAWLVFDRKLQHPVKIALGEHGFAGFISGHYLVASPPLTEAEYQAQHQGLPYHHVMQVIDTNTFS